MKTFAFSGVVIATKYFPETQPPNNFQPQTYLPATTTFPMAVWRVSSSQLCGDWEVRLAGKSVGLENTCMENMLLENTMWLEIFSGVPRIDMV